jgi:hypothetical protein
MFLYYFHCPKRVAELYYCNGQSDKAIIKIKENRIMVEDPKKKEEYNILIKKYSERQ